MVKRSSCSSFSSQFYWAILHGCMCFVCNANVHFHENSMCSRHFARTYIYIDIHIFDLELVSFHSVVSVWYWASVLSYLHTTSRWCWWLRKFVGIKAFRCYVFFSIVSLCCCFSWVFGYTNTHTLNLLTSVSTTIFVCFYWTCALNLGEFSDISMACV